MSISSSVQKTILVILDGWGLGDGSDRDAISAAHKPNWDKYWADYPSASLLASGVSVGLPEGVIGNSEVGHLNLGAGRIVDQDLVKINKACQNGELAKNENLRHLFDLAKEPGRNLHLIGLVSDAGVHAMDSHLHELCRLAQVEGLSKKLFIHALTDGRDSDPHSGQEFINRLEQVLAQSGGTLATVVGRYYTMDRDKRWERTKVGYDLMVKGAGEAVQDFVTAIKTAYTGGQSDEFLPPMIKRAEDGSLPPGIKNGDVVLCVNFRTERLRQITFALSQADVPEVGLKRLNLHYFTMTNYDESFRAVTPIFDKENVSETLGEILSQSGLQQYRLAETEKYAHVTFFFSGGREEPFVGEERLLIPSPKVPTYDLQPEMSAYPLLEAAVDIINKEAPHFICINFANCDMVGHSGSFPAIVKAVETVDQCLGRLIEAAQSQGYELLVLADHGNAEQAKNSDGSPNTAHSLNPVPCLLISHRYQSIKSGILADVAPTILELMGLPQPAAMTGRSLLVKG